MPSELSRERTAFYHVGNRAQTRQDQQSYNTTINSSGIDDAVVQAYREILPRTDLKSDVDTWITTNTNVIEKHDKVALTELAGSNGQTWYIEKDGERVRTFITEQFLVDLGTNTVPNAYVFELYRGDGTRIPPATYDWWVIPDEGLIRFEAGSTPSDLGIGTPTATVYSGLLAVSGVGGTLSADPITLGDPNNLGTWIIVRDLDDNLDQINCDIPTLNSGSLEFLRYEDGQYRRKVTFDESVHTDRFIVDRENGGYYLPMGENNDQFVRALRKASASTGDVIINGNYATALLSASDDRDSFYTAFPEDEAVQKVHVKGHTGDWDYLTPATFYTLPLNKTPYSRIINSFGVYNDTANVRYRAKAFYNDNNVVIHESSTEYEFEQGAGELTKSDITFVRFFDPLSIEAGRDITLQIQFESPVGLRYWTLAPTPTDALHYIFTESVLGIQRHVTLDFYNPSYLGQTIKVGDKFHDYEGVICIREHVGVYPMNIFDGNWKRVGDSRYFKHIGTEQELYNRLVKTYTSPGFTEITPPVDSKVFAETSLDTDHDVQKMFRAEFNNHLGSDTNGWLSASLELPPMVPQFTQDTFNYCELQASTDGDYDYNNLTDYIMHFGDNQPQSVINCGTLPINAVAQTGNPTGLLRANTFQNDVVGLGAIRSYPQAGKEAWFSFHPHDHDWTGFTAAQFITHMKTIDLSLFSGIVLNFEPTAPAADELVQVDGLRQVINGIKADTDFDSKKLIVRAPLLYIYSPNATHGSSNAPATYLESLLPINDEGNVDYFIGDFSVNAQTAGVANMTRILRFMAVDTRYRWGYNHRLDVPYENLIALGDITNTDIPLANVTPAELDNVLALHDGDGFGNGGLAGIGIARYEVGFPGENPQLPWSTDFAVRISNTLIVNAWQPPAPAEFPMRVWYDLGEQREIGTLSYNNYHDAGENNTRGIKDVDIYLSRYLPNDQVTPGETGQVLVFSGELQPHDNIDDIQTTLLELPGFNATFRFITLDIKSNWGATDYVGFRHMVIGTPGESITATRPDTVGTVYKPVWGDNGNGQGTVIETVSIVADETHGPTEWAEADKEGWSTLHSETLQAIADNGKYLLFDPWPDRDGHADWVAADHFSMNTLHLTGSRIVLATQQGNTLDTVDPDDGSLLIFSEWIADIPEDLQTHFPRNVPLSLATGNTTGSPIIVRDSQTIGIPTPAPGAPDRRDIYFQLDRSLVTHFGVSSSGTDIEGSNNPGSVLWYISINGGSSYKVLDTITLMGNSLDYSGWTISYVRQAAADETMVINGTNGGISNQLIYEIKVFRSGGAFATAQFTFERLANM